MHRMAQRSKRKPPAPAAVESDDRWPTKKHVATLDAFKRLTVNGKPPSTRQLAEALQISQTAAQARLKECRARGLLVRKLVQMPGPLTISKEGERWLAMAD
jgi:DNA-binding transcriptional MocR family regulator